MTPLRVAILIFGIFFAILIGDALLYGDSIARNSISQVIIDLSSRTHLVPWFVGFVMGFLANHWFEMGDKNG